MKRPFDFVRLLPLVIAGSLPVAFVACDKFNTCENTLSCSWYATGGGNPGGASGDGDAGGAPGDGGGQGKTGGQGGEPSACMPECDGDTPICDEEAEKCVECLEKEDCSDALCDTDSNTCVECLESADCSNLAASLCDEGTCSPCAADADCERFEDTPVCDESSGTCVECTSDTEEELCGEFSCSSLTQTCTTTKRGILGTCEACEADSECAVNRKCVLDQFGGEDVGYFCFLEQGTIGCGDVETTRRPYSTIVESTSLDETEPQNFCLPPSTTTCKGIKDTRNVSCSTSDECGLPDLDDGYCPTAGDGAGLCSYLCGGGADCSSPSLECGDTPQHCNPAP